MWSQAAEISAPWFCLAVALEGASGAANRVLFCLPKSPDTFLSDIFVSIFQYLVTKPRLSRDIWPGVDFVPEGGGEDVD